MNNNTIINATTIELLKYIRDTELNLVKFNDDESTGYYYLCDSVSIIHSEVKELLTKIVDGEYTLYSPTIKESPYYNIIHTVYDTPESLYDFDEVLFTMQTLFSINKNRLGAPEWWNVPKDRYDTPEKLNYIIQQKKNFLTKLIQILDGNS